MATTTPFAPADTRLMTIVHNALRRDLGRARTALAAEPLPEASQRAALADHLVWMMRFLEAHHRTEDDGLYPMVRARDPAAGALLDQMQADHAEISPAIGVVARAAAAFRRDAAQRERVLDALAKLEDVLLPHLAREEHDAMPVVSATITEPELRQWDEESNIKPKSLQQLAFEGHWLLDEATPDQRDLVLHLVPAVPRFVLLHGFARTYRRHRQRCWEPRIRRVQKHGTVEVIVAAAPEVVMEIARDVTRVGEWSHECVGAKWLGGATTAAPGARFRGRNRNGVYRWGRVCEILEVGPRVLVWKTVPTRLFPDSSEWRIEAHPDPVGSRIVQSFRVLAAPTLLDPVYATMLPGHRDRTEALRADIERLGNLACSRRDR